MNRDNQQQTVSDVDIGWLAGIIEGEGTIGLQIHNRISRVGGQQLRVTPRVIITNTDEKIIEKCLVVLQQLGVGRWVRQTRPNNVGRTKKKHLVRFAYKDCTYIHIDGFKRIFKLLSVLHPVFAGEKRERARILLKLIGRRLVLAEKLDLGSNFRYDQIDVDTMLEFLRLTRSPNIDKIAGMLNEYTPGSYANRQCKKSYEARLKMDSELTGDGKSSSETKTAS